MNKSAVYQYAASTRTGQAPIYKPCLKPKVNQDALFVHNEQNYWLFGVCDGHGTNGHFVSEFIKAKLPGKLREAVLKSNASKRLKPEDWMSTALKEAVRQTNMELLAP